MSLGSCALSWITCGGVPKQESATPGVFAAGSCPAPSMLSVAQPGRRAANTLLLSLSLLRASSPRPYVWSARPWVTAAVFLRESLGCLLTTSCLLTGVEMQGELNDCASLSSRDTGGRRGMAAAVRCCGNRCLYHNLPGQTAEVRTLWEAGGNAFILSC